MRTSDLTNQGKFLSHPVGQLAKSKTFPLKPNENKALRVGRHKNKTPRTSAHTHEGTPAHDFNTEKLLSLSDLDLKNYLITALNNQQPELDLFVHNGDYLDAMQDVFSSKEHHIFKLLLRFFALQNATPKQNKKNKIILTNESNFLQVLQVIKQRKLAKLNNQIKPIHKQNVLDILHQKIKARKFDIHDITNRIYLLNEQVQRIFDLLVYEKKIFKCTNTQQKTHYYSLTQTPFSRVISQ